MRQQDTQTAERVSAFLGRVESLRVASPLAAPRVTVLGACKSQPPEALELAISAGLTEFGENRVQEAKEKWPALKARHPAVRLHFIGALQTNKVEEALGLFDVIQTVDRPKLAEALARERESGIWNLEKKTRFKIQDSSFYVQINTGEEPQKAGVSPKDADRFIDYCRSLKLPVTGLMCVPPADQPPAPHFALLREIARRHDLDELSMGMSGDWETAVRMGATCIRIGTAIFGERN